MSIEFIDILLNSISILLSATAILLYIFLWYRDKKDKNYDVFDSIYLDILKIAIENPGLRDEFKCRNYNLLTLDEKLRYETYAFICWNFCETIYDKHDSNLMLTWGCVIQTENSIHRAWFDNPSNHAKFKNSFRIFIETEYPK